MIKSKFSVDREKLTVVLERIFDAPRELVYKAYTDPEAVPRWWGPSWLTTEVDKMEVKVGGVWRYVQRDKDGNVHGFNGEYKEIVPNKIIVSTFEYEAQRGHIVMQTVRFENFGDKTKLVTIAKFENIEDLEGMVQAGMEGGQVESMDRLEELLKTI